MAELGKMNRLRIVKKRDFGAYLDGGEMGEILLPLKYVPAAAFVGDEVDVFVYKDSEDRPVATTQTPFVSVGGFASLKAVATGTIGAFLDWGLEKDLLLPYGEQRDPVVEGRSYVVHAYIDNSGRIAASARVERYLKNSEADLAEGQEVELLIYSRSEIGYSCVINDCASGLIFKNEAFRPLKVGQRLTGYIKRLREDEKIDLTLEKPGYQKILTFTDVLLEELRKSDGYIDLNDKSSPERIYARFGTSKKNFKKAVGALYRDRKIILEDEGIRLNTPKT